MRALPVGAVPLLPPPGAAAPLRRRRELRQVPHAGALPHGFVPDAHAEELDGPSRARARVVPVVPALRAPPGPVAPATAGARRRRRRRAVTHHGDWTGGIWLGLVAGGIPFFSPRGFFFILSRFLFYFWAWWCVFIWWQEKRQSRTRRVVMSWKFFPTVEGIPSFFSGQQKK